MPKFPNSPTRNTQKNHVTTLAHHVLQIKPQERPQTLHRTLHAPKYTHE